jgi:hypothetical protein
MESRQVDSQERVMRRTRHGKYCAVVADVGHERAVALRSAGVVVVVVVAMWLLYEPLRFVERCEKESQIRRVC